MTQGEQPRSIAEHLQAAAEELIAAARGVLDKAEEVVRDPGRFLGPRPPIRPPARPVERIEVRAVREAEPPPPEPG